MPVQDCNKEGKPGFKWGDSGVCYPYDPSNEDSKKEARDRAIEQGRAIEANKNNNLKSKKDVEIFSTGIWNGDKYTIEDLDEMVRAFNELGKGFPAPLKLGHDEKQKILQNSGLPAAGWITNLRRKGEKLIADFDKIPSKIFDLMEKGAYRKVSSEIYWNLKVGKILYKRVLGAVALLGGENPGVMNLDDILNLYGFKDCETIKQCATNKNVKIYFKEDFEGDLDMSAEKIKELETENAKKEEQLRELAEKLSKFEKRDEDEKAALEEQIADLKKFKQEKEDELKEKDDKIKLFEAETKKAKEDAFMSELESANLLTPSTKPYIKALIGEEKKDYSITTKDKKKKDYENKHELIKDFLKLYSEAAKVNFEENSNVDKENSSEDALEQKVKEYQKENECDYRTAVAAVYNTLEVSETEDEDE